MKLLLVLILTFLTLAFGAEQPQTKYVYVDSATPLDLSFNRNSEVNFVIDSNSDKEYKISYMASEANSPQIENIVLNKANPSSIVKFSKDGVYKIKNNVNDNIITLRVENLYAKEANHKENDKLGGEYIERETYDEYNSIAKRIDQSYNNKKTSNNDNISNTQNDIGQVTQQQQQQQQQAQQQPKPNIVNSSPKTDAKAKSDATAPKTDAKSPKVDAAAPKTDATAPKTDATAPKTDAAAPKTDAADAKADNGNNSNVISVSIKMIAVLAISLLVFL